MVSSQQHNSLKTFLLLHILLILNHFSSSNAQIYEQSEKVDLTLYYETLCPFCSYFIANDLVKLFNEGLISIVNLKLVPWGNADIDSSGYFQCQHGSKECLLNTVEACAINVYPDPYTHFSLVHCIESLAYQQREAEWQSCFSRLSLNPQPIYDCYNLGNGRRLELQNAYETKQLNPPHAYVPWVVVNNQPLREDYRNFAAHVCRSYKGTSIPAVCSSYQSLVNSCPEKTTAALPQVCTEGRQRNLTSFLPTEIVRQSKQIFAGKSGKD